MRLLLTSTLMVLLAAGCTTSSEDDAGPPISVDGSMDSGPPAVDSGPETCETDVDCDDGFPCTIDTCVVGNVCEHLAVQERCPDGQVCTLTMGCRESTGDCRTDADCDDMDACTGVEMCLREMCVPGRAFDCDDGNDCTTDICDQTLPSMCRYEVAPGCDAGPMGGGDAGPGCDPFDPTMHYTGRFTMLPSQNCGAGSDMYTVNTIDFSVAAGTLTAQVGRFTLTQTPAPTGPTFSVSGTSACASVTLTGTFECADRFTMGTWTANHSGACAACGSINRPGVVGVRQ